MNTDMKFQKKYDVIQYDGNEVTDEIMMSPISGEGQRESAGLLTLNF